MPPSPPANASHPSRFTPQQTTVLVIEDDSATHAAMRVLLEHFDYHVLHARTVADGLKLLERKPQYLFLDLMLPDGDGISVLEEVRQRGLSITVVVITGTNDPIRLERVQALHPDRLLRKPLDFLAMLRQLQTDTRSAG